MPYKDRAKQNAFCNVWLKRRREQWLQENGPCANCGFWGDLQVDHIDGNEKVSHRVWSWSKVRRDEELKKCQVLCRFCHSLKTAAEAREMFTTTPRTPQVDPQVNGEGLADVA